MQLNPFVFLPVEIINRELDYKLNIARLFCQHGFDVMIGNPAFIRDELRYKNFKGIFIEKGANPEPDYYRLLKDKGLYCYDLSDEGLGKNVYSITYEPCVRALLNMRKIFFWGLEQKEEFCQKCQSNDLKNNAVTIGNPSLDLSFPKFKQMHNALKNPKLPSDFILINMNFPSLFGTSVSELLNSCKNMSPQTYDLICEEFKSEKKIYPIFYSWLEEIIRSFPKEMFVVRPHPCEIEKHYRKIFSKYKNVMISKEGHVNNVISSAKLVLHKDCSTALQSYLAGVPVISLGGEALNKNYVQWPLAFSLLPKNLQEAKEMIDKICRHDPLVKALQEKINKEAKPILNHNFSNLGNSTQVLLDTILKDAEAILKKNEPYKITDSRSLFQKLKLFIRKFFLLHYKVSKATRLTLIKVTKKDVVKRLELLEVCDSTGISFKVSKVFPNTYKIEKKK